MDPGIRVGRTIGIAVVLAVAAGGWVSAQTWSRAAGPPAAVGSPAASTVAAGLSGPPVPPDRITWTRVDEGAGFTDAPGVYGIGQLPNGRLVVVGSVGAPQETAAAWVSKDGSTWRSLKGLRLPEVSVLYAVETLDQFAVAVGRTTEGRGVVLGSADGSHWTSTITPGGPIYDVARPPVGLVGVGVDGAAAAVWLSSDGTSWFESPLAPSGRAVHVVVGSDGTTVASGAITDAGGAATPVVWTSHGAQEWTQTVLPGLTPGHWSNPLASFTPAGYVVTFADLGQPNKVGHVFSSSDGTAWTETLVDELGPLTAAGSVGSDALLIGHGEVIRSQDAVTWTAAPEPTFDGWSVRDVMSLADGRLFAAGDVFATAMATWTGTVASTP